MCVFIGLFLRVLLTVWAPWLTTAVSSEVDAQEHPASLASSAPPEFWRAAGTALHRSQTAIAQHSSH